MEERRAIWADRYDSYILAMAAALRAGDPAAVRAATRIGAEDAKLHGLYAPIQVEISDELARLAIATGWEVTEVRAVLHRMRTDEGS